MTNIILKCMNQDCNNYKQELNAGTEICSLCNTEISRFESKVNPKLKLVAICTAVLSLVLFMWAWGIPFWASFVIAPVSVILAFVSKSKAAIITANLSLTTFAGLFVYFFIIM